MTTRRLNLTFDQLTALLDHLNEGGVAGAGSFKQVVDANGKLALYSGSTKIMEQDADGTWVRTGLYTGANSIHLGGDGNNQTKSHSLSVGGQNVVFINEWSEVGGNRIAFSPAWEGLSCNGDTVVESSTRTYSAKTNVEPDGALGSGNTPYSFNLNASSNFVAFAVTIVPSENYTGRLFNVIRSNGATVGSELNGEWQDVVLQAGTPFTYNYSKPYWVNSGDALTIQFLKEDGSILSARQSATGGVYRQLSIRPFEFKALALKDELADKVDKVAGKQLSDENFTTANKDKLASLQERFLGVFADAAARDAEYPSPLNGQYCKQIDTGSFWFYGAGVWVDTGSNSTGDMLVAIYDPQDVAANTFDRANHTGTQAIATVDGLQAALNGKQDTLSSGGNIATINGQSLLTGGDIVVSGGTDQHNSLDGRDSANAHPASAISGLGTAATANVTTSSTDTAAGRLLKVGDGGINAIAPVFMPLEPSATTLDGLAGGLYRLDNSNGPNQLLGGAGGIAFVVSHNSGAKGVLAARIGNVANPEITYTNSNTSGAMRTVSLYHNANILGTVSQSAGVPTGAIIQRGSNANGEFVRFADGTQICTFNYNETADVNIAEGQIFRSSVLSWNFPVAFVGSFPSINGQFPQVGAWFSQRTMGLSGVTFVWQAALNFTNDGAATICAIGRWY